MRVAVFRVILTEAEGQESPACASHLTPFSPVSAGPPALVLRLAPLPQVAAQLNDELSF